MKKIHINRWSLAVLMTAFTGVAFSQSDLAAADASSKRHLSGGAVGSTELVNARVARSFYNHFKFTGNLNWRIVKDEYIAEFKAEDRLAIAWFSKAARLICTNYYGTSKHLPAVEQEMMASLYKDYDITATTEIRNKNGVVWIVSIQNCSQVKKIKIADQEMQEIESLKRLN